MVGTPKDILDIHPFLMDRVRLAIMATLAAEKTAVDFNTMLEKLPLTKGNFSIHAAKLEQAGLIRIDKKFIGKKPVTSYEITQHGQAALNSYLTMMKDFIVKKIE